VREAQGHSSSDIPIHIPAREVHAQAEIDPPSPYLGGGRVSMFPYTARCCPNWGGREHILRLV